MIGYFLAGFEAPHELREIYRRTGAEERCELICSPEHTKLAAGIRTTGCLKG